MDRKTQLDLLHQMSGYFRKRDQSVEEGIAEGMEKMLIIGLTHGAGGVRASKNCMSLFGMPEHWQAAVLEALKID